MSDYRRIRRPGATVFFSVCLAEPGSMLLVDEIACLRAAVRATMAQRPFEILAWVVLPDHLHCVWRLPQGDADYSTRWGAIKARFTRSVKARGVVGVTPTLRGEGRVGLQPTRGLWQRRFWEHHIRDEADLTLHLRYCWSNPVKHGLVRSAAAWRYSSLHRELDRGRVEPGFTACCVDGRFGEPRGGNAGRDQRRFVR